MWYFERNFVALSEMLNETELLEKGMAQFELGNSLAQIKLLEQTPYTQLIQIRHQIMTSDHLVPDVIFSVRIYSDAKLAEVTQYQGKTRIQAKYRYPNQQMYMPDEKSQMNLLLYDWLCTCNRLNYKDKIIENCQN